jgi:hypothetical protein
MRKTGTSRSKKRSRLFPTVIGIGVILLLGAGAVYTVIWTKTSPAMATRVLEDAGYKNIKITGYRWTGCGEDDSQHTGFEALGQAGRSVTGVVCSSWGLFVKGATVRLD